MILINLFLITLSAIQINSRTYLRKRQSNEHYPLIVSQYRIINYAYILSFAYVFMWTFMDYIRIILLGIDVIYLLI